MFITSMIPLTAKRWLAGVVVRMLNLGSRARGFHYQSGHYELKWLVATLLTNLLPIWVTVCLQTSYILTNAKVNSAFHPSGVGKSSTVLSGWG